MNTVFSVLTFPDATYSNPSLTTFSNPSLNFFTGIYFNFHQPSNLLQECGRSTPSNVIRAWASIPEAIGQKVLITVTERKSLSAVWTGWASSGRGRRQTYGLENFPNVLDSFGGRKNRDHLSRLLFCQDFHHAVLGVVPGYWFEALFPATSLDFLTMSESLYWQTREKRYQPPGSTRK